MNLIIIAALVAVTGAAKLDRTYLPPASAKTAGGSPGALQAPTFEANAFQAPKSLEASKSFQGPNSFAQNAAPKGSYTNEFQGVVVDAALAGTRDSGPEATGLGGPRNSYGSTASKVGDAAFRGAQAGFRFPVNSQDEFESNSQFGASIETDNSQFATPRGSQNFGISRDSTPENSQTFGLARETPDNSQVFGAEESRPERPQAAQDRASSTLRFDSEVGPESFNYAFETDNGISAEESGIATNGVQAQGGFSYTGDDGKVYTVTYTADEGGYQPRGDHLPTPPPIPEEILRSLEQNAKDEANGVVDDGFYDAQKYNEGGDYAESDSVNGKQNGRPSVTAVAGNSDIDASGSFISQNNIPFNPNNQIKEDKAVVNRFQSASHAGNGNFLSNAASGNRFGSRNEYLPPFNNQNRPQSTKPQITTANAGTPDADSSSTFVQESTEQGSGDFDSQPHQTHSHSDSMSFATRPTESRFNAFQQSGSSNRNQFNQNGNRFPSSQGSRQQFAAAPMNAASNNGKQQFSAQSGTSTFASQQATSVPDTELTTPFESTPQKGNAQPSAPTATPFGFNSQSSRPGQSQFGFHNAQKEASQAPAQPTIPSFAQSRPQNINNRPQGNRNTQTVFSSQSNMMEEKLNQQPQFGNKRPQFQQTQFLQNSDNQFLPRTQKPQVAHQLNAQDDSYYYNQPSRAFNTPQNQGSRFPSSSSNQFNRVTQRPTFTSQVTEEENYPSTPFAPQNGQRGSTKYPRPPTLPTKSTPSNNQYQSNAVASASNGITQASVSSFAAPTKSTGFNRQPFGQPRQQFQQQQQSFQSSRIPSPDASKTSASLTTAKPQSSRGQSLFEQQNFEAAQPLSQQPLQDVKQPKLDADENQSVINQQYNGEIYEYTKPAETLPPPESGFGQFGTKVQSSKPTQSRPQFSQTPSAEAKPTRLSFGQSNGFEQSATGSQDGEFQSQSQFGQAKIQSERPAPTSFASKPMRFGQSNKASQHDQSSAQTSPQEQATYSQFNAEASSHFGNQEQSQSVEQPKNDQFEGQRRPFSSQTQGNFASATAEVSRPGTQNEKNPCCNAFGQKPTFGQVNAPSQFEGENQFEPKSSFQGSSGLSQEQSQSVAGKGEVFGGPRKPPSFDESGYHY